MTGYHELLYHLDVLDCLEQRSEGKGWGSFVCEIWRESDIRFLFTVCFDEEELESLCFEYLHVS